MKTILVTAMMVVMFGVAEARSAQVTAIRSNDQYEVSYSYNDNYVNGPQSQIKGIKVYDATIVVTARKAAAGPRVLGGAFKGFYTREGCDLDSITATVATARRIQDEKNQAIIAQMEKLRNKRYGYSDSEMAGLRKQLWR